MALFINNPLIETKQDEPTKVRYSIRFKLLLIVSLIVLVSLSSMIYLVTYFYKSNSELLIQEYNLSLARLTGTQLEMYLKNTGYKIHLMGSTLIQKNIPDPEKQEQVNTFFSKNREYLFVGIASKQDNSYIFDYQYTNEKVFQDNKMDSGTIKIVHDAIQKDIMRSIGGAVTITNISDKFNFSVLAFMIPFEGQPGKSIVLYLESRDLVGTIQSSFQADIFQVFMVNERGEVLVHSQDSEAISNASKIELPIVRKMLTHQLDNGSQKYHRGGVEYLGSFQLMSFAGLGVVSTVESNLVFEAVYKIQKRSIVITIIVITISFVIIFLFSKTLTVPLVKLVGAATQVKKGDYKVSIEPVSKDEVGMLTSAFADMAKGLQERENIKNTFGKFVNKEIAERALHGELMLGGVKKNCAILFSDLRSFTAMSEKLEPEQVVGYLNEYFTEMVEYVYLTHGVVDKFIGDAIMAHWGALYTDGKDTENAIDAAIMMRKALIKFNQTGEKTGRPKFRFGCGINTGPVIAGQIGSEKKLEYTIIGDAVNLASRIEYLNKQFGTDILISENSYEFVKDLYNVVIMDPIEIRGKSKPQQIYAVLGRKIDSDSPKDLFELRARVGIPPLGNSK